jgi:hypothetical protein
VLLQLLQNELNGVQLEKSKAQIRSLEVRRLRAAHVGSLRQV